MSEEGRIEDHRRQETEGWAVSIEWGAVSSYMQAEVGCGWYSMPCVPTCYMHRSTLCLSVAVTRSTPGRWRGLLAHRSGAPILYYPQQEGMVMSSTFPVRLPPILEEM